MAGFDHPRSPYRLRPQLAPRPATAPPGAVAPVGKPDADKLLRAIQDALSPRLRKGERAAADVGQAHMSRFRLLDDDSYAVDTRAVESFPTPGEVHPWALPEPGVVIRVSPCVAAIDMMPPVVVYQLAEVPA